MKKILLPLHQLSTLWIGHDTLAQIGSIVTQEYHSKRVAVVSDHNVWQLYGEKLSLYFHKEGIQVCPILIHPGESGKSGESYLSILSQLAEIPLTRKELLIAFGGGVVGDVAGFCAATYMRGIEWMQIPTTLVGQIDSSVGGKNAINLPEGKNLAGTFYQPKHVWIDTQLLNTLPPKEFSGGMGEMIKYGILMGEPLLSLLQQYNTTTGIPVTQLQEMVVQCCTYKGSVVQRDEFDHGERALLNLGHSFGHAIEAMTNFQTFTHGEAVAMGIIYSALYSEVLWLCAKGFFHEILRLCKNWSLPYETPLSVDKMVSYLVRDKKADVRGINLILIKGMGDCFVRFTPFAEIEENMCVVERMLKEYVWKQQ